MLNTPQAVPLICKASVVQGNLDTEGEARGVQIHIYTDNEVYNRFKLCYYSLPGSA